MNNEISKVFMPDELEEARFRMTEIRFECLVKMFDFGQIEPSTSVFSRSKPLPPQWFKMQTKLTLEFIKYSDEYAIGRAIKQAFHKLEGAIREYEQNYKTP